MNCLDAHICLSILPVAEASLNLLMFLVHNCFEIDLLALSDFILSIAFYIFQICSKKPIEFS